MFSNLNIAGTNSLIGLKRQIVKGACPNKMSLLKNLNPNMQTQVNILAINLSIKYEGNHVI